MGIDWQLAQYNTFRGAWMGLEGQRSFDKSNADVKKHTWVGSGSTILRLGYQRAMLEAPAAVANTFPPVKLVPILCKDLVSFSWKMLKNVGRC